MLSLHTNTAALSTENALNATQASLSNTLTQLGTGYRVNSAMDDAAGLQIATRLTSETQGMTQAQSNTADGISMLQTADGALSETSNILLSMKDLATEANTASSTAADQTALQSQYDALGQQLLQIFQGTTYGGAGLFSDGTAAGAVAGNTGALGAAAGLTFQIGDQAADTMNVNTSTALGALSTALGTATAQFSVAPPANGTELTGGTAGVAITNLTAAIADVGTLRSQIGAGANRLQDVSANLTNMITNTTAATGNIMDVDYASASANSSSDQLLLQAGTAALKQANSVSQIVISLLQ
ncbi:MAG: flagellin [Steroidobacteraceae bacterium]